MQCANCEHENLPQAKFCAKCGRPFLAAGEASLVSNGLKIGMSIVSFLIPPIGMTAGIIFIADPNPSKKAAGAIWLIVAVLGIVTWSILSKIQW
jgi:hypothetical protein